VGLRAATIDESAVEAAGLAVFLLGNWVMTALVGAAALGTSPIAVIRRNLNRQWVGAFIYIAISAALLHGVLDGSVHGYLLGLLTALLSLALADAVAGRQLSQHLLSQLSDLERHLTYSRVVEGTIHNVRNFLAVAIGSQDEALDSTDLAIRERQLTLSRAAMQDAADALTALQTGSSPKVVWSQAPIEICPLCDAVAAASTDRATAKRVRLDVSCAGEPAVYCDPGLIRQVLLNLVFNGIDAAPSGGHVWISTTWRLGDCAVSVGDDGPGIHERFRDRLFEPHFTTKPDGSGLGLFVSYGIAREHRGDLLYEGDARGAVFTLLLRPDGRIQPRAANEGELV
jgi:signal transduction histidine kinase